VSLLCLLPEKSNALDTLPLIFNHLCGDATNILTLKLCQNGQFIIAPAHLTPARILAFASHPEVQRTS
jgi:hypothetical protein